mgnify:CR=1 FL=1
MGSLKTNEVSFCEAKNIRLNKAEYFQVAFS